MTKAGLGWLLATAALVLGVPAWPQGAPNPFVTPQRDVDVTYLIAGPRSAAVDPGSALPPPSVMTQRMRWSAALWSQRLDPAGNAYMITDYRARRILVVDPRRATATLLPLPATPPGGGVQSPGLRATGRYDRLGEDAVAGLPCTEWRTIDDGGADSVICLTPDGVLLRARHAGQVLLLASRVSYAAQDPALFAAPSGTRVEQPPSQ
ncbi:hypothetical protein [Lichenicoccus sp.]|uniref:hypothetical protein n=1 Tax=Lichenicoccus sp. TaxID=2781899 RepID=UPI003D139AB5